MQPSGMGLLLYRIAFTHPSHIPKILEVRYYVVSPLSGLRMEYWLVYRNMSEENDKVNMTYHVNTFNRVSQSCFYKGMGKKSF